MICDDLGFDNVALMIDLYFECLTVFYFLG